MIEYHNVEFKWIYDEINESIKKGKNPIDRQNVR